ncbi:MAG: serine/threonine-protein kinase [Thermoguttaceae bacterium]
MRSQVSSTGRIDQMCDQFEKACQAGNPPLIEEVLLQAPPSERDRLLGELLEIEIDVRQRSGAFLQLEEYRGRFPESADIVESVFRRIVKTRRLGDYELLEELGRGGMGVVYKARQIYLNQTVALKILPHRYLDDSQAVSRFRREMQSIGGLNHPNIVRAYNAGEAGGVHFLVMEFVDGINLQQFVGMGNPPGGPLGVGAACEIIRQAALGLQHAHEHQLVHRDVKPANLMLCRSGQVKLLDLGLAKFHSEWRGDAQPQRGLTQPGVTMGTIDYMAPEQWENSATADIRADIYSLGCTLFFLLTGRTPYGDPAYDTSRKKLMAHVVAPIPSLAENCPDCPQDLEEVYETMLAKDPRERYAIPADVVAAMTEFADEEELAEVIAAMASDDAWAAASRADLQSPECDTARKQGAGSVGANARRSISRRLAKRRFRRNVQLVLFGSLAAVTLGFLAWLARRPADDPLKDSTTSSAVTSLSATTPANADPPLAREPIAAELALLPGLNGPWWFEEMPWLTPPLRQAIATKVLSSADPAAVLGRHPHRYLDPNTAEVQTWLWEAAERCRRDLSPSQLQLLDQLKAFSDGNHDNDLRAARALDEVLKHFVAGNLKGPLSPFDLHAQALLQHRIALLAHDKLRAQEAKKSYDMALDTYSAQQQRFHQVMMPTRLLCLVDSARLCAEMLGDTKEAKQRLDEALAAVNLPVLFHVSTLVARGDIAAASATNSGEYEDHRFIYAKKLLAGFDAVKPTHPLAAHIDERYAWSLMDQWKVEEASKQLQAAYHIRVTDQEEKNPFAAIHVFHDRHGIAMAARYRGNLDAARRTYKTVVDEIQTALAEAQRQRGVMGQPSAIRALRERLSNSLERWADCELYSGAVSDGKVNLPQAAESYDQAQKIAPEWSDAVVMGYKLAIVRSLSGKRQTARDVLAALDADQRQVLEVSKERVTLVKQVADAVLAINGPAPADGRKDLRAFLDQFKLNPAYRDSSRRETMELQLFAAELLLNWDLESEPKSAVRDLKYLDVLLAVFKGRRDIRPYLRRYYELAIRACNKSDLVQIAHYLIESRMDERKGSLDSKATLVLFSFTSKDNFAVVLPQDGRPGKRIALDLTRDQIKEAKGKSLHLNDELVSLIKAETDAGRAVEIFWDDTASRPSADPDALSDRDWPFDSQLDLARLRPQSRKS